MLSGWQYHWLCVLYWHLITFALMDLYYHDLYDYKLGKLDIFFRYKCWQALTVFALHKQSQFHEGLCMKYCDYVYSLVSSTLRYLPWTLTWMVVRFTLMLTIFPDYQCKLYINQQSLFWLRLKKKNARGIVKIVACALGFLFH